MKIVLKGIIQDDKSKVGTLYNAIKRYEVDLKSHIPTLKKFEFVLKENWDINSPNGRCIHYLDDAKENLNITYMYRQFPTKQAIVKDLTLKLNSLLKMLLTTVTLF